MTFFYLFASIVTSGFSGNLYKRISKQSTSSAMSALFPALWFFPLALVFFVGVVIERVSVQSLLHTALLLPALGAGIGMAAAATILIESMKKTSLSISVILVNLNFIIPVFLSAVFLRENTGWLQLVGMILAVAAILWLNLRKDENHMGFGRALVLPCVACAANGMVNFCIKLHQSSMGEEYLQGFYGIMYLSAASLCLLLYFFLKKNTSPAIHTAKENWTVIMTSAGMLGICNGVCFYMTGLLAGRMNAAAQFTVITAASILVSLIIGCTLQKEPVTKKSVFSFLFCLLAIFCQASGM